MGIGSGNYLMLEVRKFHRVRNHFQEFLRMRVRKHAYMFQLTEGISLHPVGKDPNGHRDGGAGDSRKVKSRWFKRVKGKEGVKKSLPQVRQSTSRLTMLCL